MRHDWCAGSGKYTAKKTGVGTTTAQPEIHHKVDVLYHDVANRSQSKNPIFHIKY